MSIGIIDNLATKNCNCDSCSTTFNTFILALFIFCTFNEVLSQFDVLVDSKSKRCDHQRAFEMPGAYCVGLKLEAIPDYLSTGIEILDFSENRLQSVKADTFASYTEFEKCPADTVNFTHLNSTHLKCKASYFNFQSVKPPRRTWLTVTGGLAGFLVGFMILLYLMHRHNVAQTKTKAEKLKKSTPAHDADKTVMVPILVNEINDESQISRL
ncbi:hypothetical protein ACJJTC_008033 [Scirpophaga incertulas]